VSIDVTDEDNPPPRPLTVAEKVLLALGIVALAVVCVVVTYTVVARAAGWPLIPDDVQIVRQFMVAVIIFPMAAVSAVRMHIVVTIFSHWMSPKTKAWLIAVGDGIGLLLVSILLAGAIRLFLDSFTSGEYYDGDIRIPYWMGHLAYTIAMAALWLRMAALTWVDFAAARSQSRES
jgi:TRAP-type C4-dicarboxylate transport system permease small subunit